METRRTNHGHEPTGYSASTVTPTGGTPFYKRISWGAIIAGTLVALVTMLMLNLLGIGIGLGSINPMQEAAPFSGLGIGAIIWWVVSNLIAIFAGAYVAGKLAGVPLGSTSTMHGILSWCLYTLVSFYILTTAVGSIISGVGSVVSSTLSAAGSGIEAVVSNSGQNQNSNQNQNQSSLISLSEIKSEVKQVMSSKQNSKIVPDSIEQRVSKVVPDSIQIVTDSTEQKVESTTQGARMNMNNVEYISDEEIEGIAKDILFENGKLADNVQRQDVINAITSRTNVSQQEANEIADVIMKKYQQAKQEVQELAAQAKQEAEEIGSKVAESTSSAAIWTFVALVLGAVVAGAGGRAGKPDTVPAVETETRL